MHVGKVDFTVEPPAGSPGAVLTWPKINCRLEAPMSLTQCDLACSRNIAVMAGCPCAMSFVVPGRRGRLDIHLIHNAPSLFHIWLRPGQQRRTPHRNAAVTTHLLCTEMRPRLRARHEHPTPGVTHVKHSEASSACIQRNTPNIAHRLPLESRHGTWEAPSAGGCDDANTQLCTGQSWGEAKELDDTALQRASPAACACRSSIHRARSWKTSQASRARARFQH